MAAGGASAPATYIEDVFSTYLYKGNGSTQTITNGIDLAGKGGLVWIKSRTTASDHRFLDTLRGAGYYLSSDTTNAAATEINGVSSFSGSGFDLGNNVGYNGSGTSYASWTFRRAPKFFDVVTFTTDSNGLATFSHSLGAVPGMITMKATSSTSGWTTWHRSLSSTSHYVQLNTIAAEASLGTQWINPTAASVSITYNGALPANTAHVAYLFAHDTSADGIIQCGSFTADANGNATVNLGWEPQYVMVKFAAQGSSGATSGGWAIYDSMRRLTVNGSNLLLANSTGAELSDGEARPTSTGFTQNYNNASIGGATYIYLAIRRPNKPPTTGTQVFENVAYSGDASADRSVGVLGSVDLSLVKSRGGTNVPPSYGRWFDRLRGNALMLFPTTADAEVLWGGGTTGAFFNQQQNGVLFKNVGGNDVNQSGVNKVLWNFRRAPGFFDEVCYTVS